MKTSTATKINRSSSKLLLVTNDGRKLCTRLFLISNCLISKNFERITQLINSVIKSRNVALASLFSFGYCSYIQLAIHISTYAKKAFKYVPNIGTGFYFIHKRPNKVLWLNRYRMSSCKKCSRNFIPFLFLKKKSLKSYQKQIHAQFTEKHKALLLVDENNGYPDLFCTDSIHG